MTIVALAVICHVVFEDGYGDVTGAADGGCVDDDDDDSGDDNFEQFLRWLCS